MFNKLRIIASVIFVLSLTCSGCYAAINGRVIDAETQQPIEGAVVLVEWTKTKGVPGMTHTESAKVIEVLTDKDGKAILDNYYDPMANSPSVTVYKKGYVAWNSEYIFPDYKKRTGFKWEKGFVFRMEHFKTAYSYDSHVSFINTVIRSTLSYEKKTLIIDAIEWEEGIARQEIKSRILR